jgi:hypothetical protein
MICLGILTCLPLSNVIFYYTGVCVFLSFIHAYTIQTFRQAVLLYTVRPLCCAYSNCYNTEYP